MSAQRPCIVLSLVDGRWQATVIGGPTPGQLAAASALLSRYAAKEAAR